MSLFRSRQPREAYVALGDSISIDDYAGGPGRGGPSLLARNRDDDFPRGVAATSRRNVRNWDST